MVLSRLEAYHSAIPIPMLMTARAVSSLAIGALRDEARLTPKPGLVDRRGGGCHDDMDVDLLLDSIATLEAGFLAMTEAAYLHSINVALREQLADIGRTTEQQMLEVTRGVNTHRGSIWALGLLSSAAVIDPSNRDPETIARVAARIARLPDRFAPQRSGHGVRVVRRFGGTGAYGEACAGFPHVIQYGLPELRASRARGSDEDVARLDGLLAIMSRLPDTCLLHRGGQAALDCAQTGAARVLGLGGMASENGRNAMRSLDVNLLQMWASPGGSADLLAATLFLDRLQMSDETDRGPGDE